MNKLRELWLRQANSTGNQYDIACAGIRDYLWSNREAITDLIDEAQHLVRACTTGDVSKVTGEHMGVRVPRAQDVAQLRAALAKLEDK